MTGNFFSFQQIFFSIPVLDLFHLADSEYAIRVLLSPTPSQDTRDIRQNFVLWLFIFKHLTAGGPCIFLYALCLQ